MPFQLHGFRLGQFDGLAASSHRLSFGELVKEVSRIIVENPDGRCVVCNLGFENHDWVDMSQLSSRFSGDASSHEEATVDFPCSPRPSVRGSE